MVLFVVSGQILFSQVKKKSVPPPIKKEVLLPPKIVRPEDRPVSKIVSIIRKNEMPMAFKFEVNKDTIILPKEEFAEVIEISNSYTFSEELDVTIISKSAVDTLKYEFNDGSKPERIAYSYYDSRKWCNGILTKETIKATDKETKSVASFRVVLDKPKKKILYLLNISNGRKYLPTAYEPPAPSIGF